MKVKKYFLDPISSYRLILLIDDSTHDEMGAKDDGYGICAYLIIGLSYVLFFLTLPIR